MANEGRVELKRMNGRPFTVADATGIAKGAILANTDPRTAILASSAQNPIAGIALREKVANDGRTELAVSSPGDWLLLYASGAIVTGDPVKICNLVSVYPNFVEKAASTSTASGAVIFARALETAANGEQFLVEQI